MTYRIGCMKRLPGAYCPWCDTRHPAPDASKFAVAEVHTAVDVDRIFAEDPTSCVAEMAKAVLRSPGGRSVIRVGGEQRCQCGAIASFSCAWGRFCHKHAAPCCTYLSKGPGADVRGAISHEDISPRAKSEPPPSRCACGAVATLFCFCGSFCAEHAGNCCSRKAMAPNTIVGPAECEHGWPLDQECVECHPPKLERRGGMADIEPAPDPGWVWPREEVEAENKRLKAAADALIKEREGLRAELAAEKEARQRAEAALDKIDAIRNSIIGRQGISWSDHIYPLVTALGESGREGEGYDVARPKAHAAVAATDRLLAIEREARALVDSLPMCDTSGCRKPATRAFCRGEGRWCDIHGDGWGPDDERLIVPEYPRAAPLRAVCALLESK